jgi:hypothetical protein
VSYLRYQEVVLGFLAIVWAIWLVGFGSYTTSPVLESFRLWGVPEWIMTAYPLSLGISILFFDLKLKRYFHLGMFLFWGFVTFGIAEGNITLTAVPVYATVTLLHAGIYLLVKTVEYR